MTEDFSISIGDRNEVLILNEYNHEFAIISGYEGNDRKHYFNMVFPRDNKTKEPREKFIPQKVRLGSRSQAISEYSEPCLQRSTSQLELTTTSHFRVKNA